MKRPSQPDPIVNMNVRIPRDVRTAAKIAAAKQGKTLNAFVAQALVKAAALAAAVLMLGACSDGRTYGETRCFLHDVREPVACDAGFTWTSDAGAYDCTEEPCTYGSACVVNGDNGVCR